MEPFWGPTQPSWTPKCADFIDWTSSLDFWAFLCHFRLSDWTFWFFGLLAEHAGASVWAVKSALPDFGVDPSLVLSRHQIVGDFLYPFVAIFDEKSIKFNPKLLKIVSEADFCMKLFLETCFFDFEASFGVFWDVPGAI